MFLKLPNVENVVDLRVDKKIELVGYFSNAIIDLVRPKVFCNQHGISPMNDRDLPIGMQFHVNLITHLVFPVSSMLIN